MHNKPSHRETSEKNEFSPSEIKIDFQAKKKRKENAFSRCVALV